MKGARRKPATIRDVAKAAGLSATAISRYLNKRVELPEATARRIDAAVASLQYRPNVVAARLSRGVTQMIGVVMPNIAYPLFAMIASAAEEEASKFGYSVIICNTRNQVSREVAYLDNLVSRHVDGLIFLTNHPDDGTLRKKLGQVDHVVLVDEDIAGAMAPKVFVDHQLGGFLATRHLIDHGHRRIAHVSGPAGLSSVQGRYAGYRRAMKEAKLRVRDGWVKFGNYDEAYGARAFEELMALTERPTAVFLASDDLATGLLGASRVAGVLVPEFLSIVGFDDLPHVKYLDPPLTTIRQSPEELGRRSVRLLIASLQGEALPPQPECLPVELIVRGSVAQLGRTVSR